MKREGTIKQIFLDWLRNEKYRIKVINKLSSEKNYNETF